MRVTKRDLVWLKLINSFGFVDINFMVNLAKVNSCIIYRRMNKLIKADYVRHEWVLHGQPGIYRVTKLGTEICHDVLPPLKSVALATYDHQIKDRGRLALHDPLHTSN